MNELDKNFQEKKARYNVLVSSILQNKAKVGQGLWDIGLALKEIKDRELYLTDIFTTYEQFLEKKAGIASRTAYRCVSIVEEFELRDFLKWGLYKLELI